MHPETFEHQAAVYEYAERNGLTYAWEGSPAFDKRMRILSPEQYQIIAVHTRRGVRKVLLFSQEIIKAEWLADEHAAAVHDYAEQNGLTYAWEGSPAFAKRLRVLSPEQYQILAAHTRRGVRKVLLFSKDVLTAEWLADKPRRDRLAAKRRLWRHTKPGSALKQTKYHREHDANRNGNRQNAERLQQFGHGSPGAKQISGEGYGEIIAVGNDLIADLIAGEPADAAGVLFPCAEIPS